METRVAMGHSCQQRRVTESDSNPRLPEQKEEKNLEVASRAEEESLRELC